MTTKRPRGPTDMTARMMRNSPPARPELERLLERAKARGPVTPDPMEQALHNIACAYRDQRAAVEALRELVRLKDLRDREGPVSQCREREEPAWEAARRALDALPE